MTEGRERLAVYWSPEPDDPLWPQLCRWLGRDAERGVDLDQPRLEGVDRETQWQATAFPRRYGAHMTVAAPFVPVEGISLQRCVEHLAEGVAALEPASLPPLTVVVHHGFLALVPAQPAPGLRHLHGTVLHRVRPLRRPPSEHEIRRRMANGLTALEEQMMRQWGYPYVFSAFEPHLTLSGRLAPDDPALSALRLAAHRHLAAAERPRRIASLAIFHEPAPGAAFSLIRRIRLAG